MDIVVYSEKPDTLKKQVEYLQTGHVPVVYFPTYTPEENIPELPDRCDKYEDERGLFYYNAFICREDTIRNSSLQTLLFHVHSIEEAMQNNVPIVVQALVDGVVIQDSMVDSVDYEALDLQIHVMKCRFPGCTIRYRLPEQVLFERMKGEF